MPSRAPSPTLEPRGRHLPVSAPTSSSPFLSGPGYAGPLKQLIGEDAGRSAFKSHSSGHEQSNYSYTGVDQDQYGQYYDNSGQLGVSYGYGDEYGGGGGGGGYYGDDGGYGTMYGGGGYYTNTTTYEAAQPQPHDQQQQQLQLAYQLQLQQQQQQQQQQFIDLGAGNTDMVTGLVRRRIIIRQLHDKATHDDVQDLLDKFAGMDKGLLRMKLVAADANRGKKCHALATYKCAATAEAAVKNLDGQAIRNRKVEVRLATEKLPEYTPHGPEPDGGGEAGEGSSKAGRNNNNNNNNNRDRDDKEKDKNPWRRPRRHGANKGGSGDRSKPVVADGSIAGKEK